MERAFAHLQAADAVLVVGSSLMVYSGFRFVQTAARNGLPIAALNVGHTRADELLTLKVEQSCAQALAFLHGSTDLLRARRVNDASARSA